MNQFKSYLSVDLDYWNEDDSEEYLMKFFDKVLPHVTENMTKYSNA